GGSEADVPLAVKDPATGGQQHEQESAEQLGEEPAPLQARVVEVLPVAVLEGKQLAGTRKLHRLAGRAVAPGRILGSWRLGIHRGHQLSSRWRGPWKKVATPDARGLARAQVGVAAARAVARSDALRFHSIHATPVRPSWARTWHIARGKCETRPSGACSRRAPNATGWTSRTSSP